MSLPSSESRTTEKEIWTCNIHFGGSKSKNAFKICLPAANSKAPCQRPKPYGACFFQCLTDQMGCRLPSGLD